MKFRLKKSDIPKSRKQKQWSKQEINILLDLWNDHTIQEVANAVGRDAGSLQYMIGCLRRHGFTLSRKHFTPPLSKHITEVLEELRKDNKI